MADDSRHRAMSERGSKADRVAHDVEHAERRKVAVVIVVPSGRAPVAPLVGSDHVKARSRERKHHFPPAIGQFGKAVEKQDAGPVFRFEAGFEQMYSQPVDAAHEAGANTGRKNRRLQRSKLRHLRVG